MDEHRILTGDTEGYVYAWDLKHCLDSSKGPESLCLRAHNAMDPDVYCKDPEKIVYAVHLETAAMIQVQWLTISGTFWLKSETVAGSRRHRENCSEWFLGLWWTWWFPTGILRSLNFYWHCIPSYCLHSTHIFAAEQCSCDMKPGDQWYYTISWFRPE